MFLCVKNSATSWSKYLYLTKTLQKKPYNTQKLVHMYKPIMGKFVFSSYSEKSPQLLFNLKTTLTVKFVLNSVLMILFLSMK